VIVVDSSALIAILLGESSAGAVSEALETSTATAIPAPTLVETLIVAEARLGAQGALNVERIMRIADIETVPFDAADAQTAVEAWRRYGRGRHHAGLNLGDCYSYAWATRRNLPLLFVGEDFARTDVLIAL
jgi:ribonuclease VapC